MATAVKLVIYLVKYSLQGVDIGYDVHPGSFNGHRKAYWAFYRAQDGHIGSYTGNMSLVPVTAGILGLIMGIATPYLLYVGHRTVTLGLIRD